MKAALLRLKPWNVTAGGYWQSATLMLGICLVALPFVGNVGTWATLTLAGIAMGMILFTIASGLSLVFGLMDVMNFGHGASVAIGGFVWYTVFALAAPWADAGAAINLLVLALALLAAASVTGALGLAVEYIVIRPVYGLHLKQILMTMGALIVGEELVKMVWGAQQIPVTVPQGFRGAYVIHIGSIVIVVEKLRAVAAVIGCGVFAGMLYVLGRTKLGVLIRAGVQDREMTEALGYHIRRIFVGVFSVGSALAGLGGVLWALYQQSVIAQMGAQLNVVAFLVVIIGGMGSTVGALVGALLISLVANYTGFLAPKLSLVSSVALMVVILMWRPRGLHPAGPR